MANNLPKFWVTVKTFRQENFEYPRAGSCRLFTEAPNVQNMDTLGASVLLN
jgi:hypothetical protein